MSLTVPVAEIVESSRNQLLRKHDSWERVTVGEIAKILNGAAFKSSLFTRSEGWPLVRIRDVGKETTDCFYDGPYEDRYIVEPGDLLVGMDGDFRARRWQGPRALLNQRVCKLNLTTELFEPRFFDTSLPGYLDAIREQTSSVTVTHLSSNDISAIPLPLPPLAEQRRIVAKLDELLARVNAARERLAKLPTILKRFRQSILASACSGQLTADWREENDVSDDAIALLGRMARERRTRWESRNPNRKYRGLDPIEPEELPQLPMSWAWTNFDHCAWEITVGHVGPMKDRYVPCGISFLRSQNIRPLRFDRAGLVFIEADFHKSLRKSALQGGEILVTRSGANTGDCCVYPVDAGIANCADLVITRPLFGLVPQYGAIYISSPDGQARIGMRETGMAQPHFNIGAMRVKPFPLPPLPEQHEIVRRVEALFVLADKVETRVQAATARVEKITQAILAKAFRGELVPTEAELARQEGRNYEPASVLLDRIRAQRAAAETNGPPTRRQAKQRSSRSPKPQAKSPTTIKRRPRATRG